jgi:hypothetical protein
MSNVIMGIVVGVVTAGLVVLRIVVGRPRGRRFRSGRDAGERRR